MRVTTPRVDSKEASNKTLHRRTEEIGHVRSLISGGAVLEQLQHEVHALSKDDRLKLLQEVGLLKADVPADEGLAMKADLSLPWNKLRILRR